MEKENSGSDIGEVRAGIFSMFYLVSDMPHGNCRSESVSVAAGNDVPHENPIPVDGFAIMQEWFWVF